MQNEEIKKTKSAPKFVLIMVIAAIGGTGIFFATTLQKRNTIKINNVPIAVERATSSDARARGLCCRDHLSENSGMLFMFDQPGDYRFWMKDTRIPLDMYWISDDKKIVHIEHSVQPTSYPNRFSSPVPAQYILETNAGFAKKHNIKVGDEVSFRT